MKALLLAITLLGSCLIPLTVSAADWRTEQPVNTDFNNLEKQRTLIDDLARRHLGRQLNNDENNNLDILQTLLDRRVIKPEDTETLQAMGAVFGNMLATRERLNWIIYIDKLGRSRALTITGSDEFIFPITLISQRYKAGITVDVRKLFAESRTIANDIRQRNMKYPRSDIGR